MANTRKIISYYEQKLKLHGATAAGVDWKNEASQGLRFTQFLTLLPQDKKFSVLDYGCGYGALYDFLADHGYKFTYKGYDLSAEMLKVAKKRLGTKRNFAVTGTLPKKTSEFTFSSGVFNVKLGTSKRHWEKYILREILRLNSLSAKGFAFNMLTSYSDVDRRKKYLYYGDPCFYFDFCKTHCASQVALLHDYGLYEFTIVVRK